VALGCRLVVVLASCGVADGGKTGDGVLPVVAAVEGERKAEKQRKWQKPGRV